MAEYDIEIIADSNGQVSDNGEDFDNEITISADENEEITIYASPDDCYEFKEWDDGNTDKERTITVEDDEEYTAYFEIKEYDVDLEVGNGQGSVSGSGTYDCGEEIVISASPDDCYEFVEWNDGNTDKEREITVDEDKEFTAHFEIKEYDLNLSVEEGNGSVSGDGTYECDEEVTISASPHSDYIFDRWDDGNTEKERTVTIDNDKSFNAIFLKVYEVEIESKENGSLYLVNKEETIESEDSKVFEVIDGETIEIQAIPEEGYQVDTWTYDNGDTEEKNPAKYEMDKDNLTPTNIDTLEIEITEDEEMSANFAIKEYFIKITPPKNGRIKVDGDWYGEWNNSGETVYNDKDHYYIKKEHGESITDIKYESINEEEYVIDKWMIDDNVTNSFDNSNPSVAIKEFTTDPNDNNKSISWIYNYSDTGVNAYSEAINSELNEDHGLLPKMRVVEVDSGNIHNGDFGVIEDPNSSEITFKYELKNPIVYNKSIELEPIRFEFYDTVFIEEDMEINNISEHNDLVIEETEPEYFVVLRVDNEEVFEDLLDEDQGEHTWLDYHGSDEPIVYNSFNYGDVVELRASDHENWEFEEWDNSGQYLPCIITGGNSDQEIEIYVDQDIFLNPSLNPDFDAPSSKIGHCDILMSDLVYGGNQPDTVKLVSAVPHYGYEFIEWAQPHDIEQRLNDIDEELSIENEQIIYELTGNDDLDAKVEPLDFDLKLRDNLGNKDSNIEILTEPEEMVFGATVQIEAQPPDDYEFSHWSGDVASTRKRIDIALGDNSGMLYNSEGNMRTNTYAIANFRHKYKSEIIVTPYLQSGGSSSVFNEINETILQDINNLDTLIEISPFKESKMLDNIDEDTLTLEAASKLSTDEKVKDEPRFEFLEKWHKFVNGEIRKTYNRKSIELDIEELQDKDEDVEFRPIFKLKNYDTSLQVEFDDSEVDENPDDKIDIEYQIQYPTESEAEDSRILNHSDKKDYLFPFNTQLTFQDKSKPGYSFKYFKNGNGEIVSRSLTYNFLIQDEKEIIAVYKREKSPLNLKYDKDFTEIEIKPENKYYIDDLTKLLPDEDKELKEIMKNVLKEMIDDLSNYDDFIYLYQYKDEIDIDAKMKNSHKFIGWKIKEGNSKIDEKAKDSTTLTFIDNTLLGLNHKPIESELKVKTKPEDAGDIQVIINDDTDNIKKNPGKLYFKDDKDVDIKVTPNSSGHTFERWNLVYENNSTNRYNREIGMHVNQNIEAIAIFEERDCYLELEIVGEGFIEDDNGNAFDGGDFPIGTELKLEATPLSVGNRFHKFSHWEVDKGSKREKLTKDNPAEITVTSDMKLYAIFERIQHGVFEGHPTKMLRNHRKNGPIESHKYNLDFNEILFDIRKIRRLSKMQKEDILGKEASGEDSIMKFIYELQENKKEVARLLKKLEFIKKIHKGG